MSELHTAIERTMLTPDTADVTCDVADVLRAHYGFLLFSDAMRAARAAVESVETSPVRRRLRQERGDQPIRDREV